MNRNVAGRILVALLIALTSLSAMSLKRGDQSADDDEIRIGNLMPYTGPLSEFAAIGKAEAAYFEMINERGGINGRKVRFISHDDNSDPTVALDLTRGLVEREDVLLMFGSYGTPGNLAVRGFLNERGIPQLFVASGAEEFSDPKAFPWTMGWQPSFRAEGRIYANYIHAFFSQRKIVVLWQNDQFGRDLYKGIQEGLGELSRLIIVGVAFDIDGCAYRRARLDPEAIGRRYSGFRRRAEHRITSDPVDGQLPWHPVFLLNNAAASIGAASGPAGLEKSAGVISASFLKDPNDPAWKDDPAMKDWASFMDKYYPKGDKTSSAALYGYAAAETLVQVLKQCGGDLSRENIMRQAAALRDYRSSVLLPGIKINTGPDKFQPIKQMRLVQFDGRTWQPIGDVIESAFADAPKN